MPCTYYTPDEERRMSAEYDRKQRAELDRLTHENDILREALIAATSGNEIDPDFLKTVHENQVKHRKEDLKRLEKTFRKQLSETNDYARERIIQQMIGAVVTADPLKPLAPQLGFDPDAF